MNPGDQKGGQVLQETYRRKDVSVERYGMDSYLAGVFGVRGSCGTSSRGTKGGRCRGWLEVIHRDPAVLYALESHYGTGKVIQDPLPSGRCQYIWKVTNAPALKILAQMYPHLM